jgi:hypothetical protein
MLLLHQQLTHKFNILMINMYVSDTSTVDKLNVTMSPQNIYNVKRKKNELIKI